jgi:glycerol kinase
MLPEIRPSSGAFGETRADVLGVSVPILGVAGDQQAATVGQACFEPGMLKSTYGTGCFALLNTGAAPSPSEHRLLTTAAYRIGDETAYALEGSIFTAGAVVQWLRDEMKMISSAAETAALAAEAKDLPVYLVPAFTGLGAPYWAPEARGALTGLTRDAGRPEIVRAALDSVCYQTRDLMEAMDADARGLETRALRVDGGMVSNDWFCQRLADLLGRPVERPEITETTALGAAYLAGLAAGVWPSKDALADLWRLGRRFDPELGADARDTAYAGWQRAVERVLG